MLTAMTDLTQHVVVNASAEAVWEVVAGRFDRIGEWAAAIPASGVAAADLALVDLAAPVPARVCETGIRALPRITETIVGFDSANRTLTYEATEGMPSFVTAARNTWTVTALSATRCRVDIVAEFSTRGLLGRLARAAILARVLRDGRHLLEDLKHYVETGTPSPRKLARHRLPGVRPARKGNRRRPRPPAILSIMSGERGASPFGVRLRRWRAHRGISQLALAAKVGSTPRHLSFLETGRSRPSRQMVLRLGEALGVGLRERNQLLQAAGLPPAYAQADLGGHDLAPYRASLGRLLHAHVPYPAMVVDSHWTVLMANVACGRLYGFDVVGANLIRLFLTDPAARQAVANWPEVAWAGLDRLHRQLDRAPFDETLAELVRQAEAALAGLARPSEPTPEPVLCPWFRIGDQVIKTIGVAARFDPVADVTLDEVRVELTYPLDDVADRFFRETASG